MCDVNEKKTGRNSEQNILITVNLLELRRVDEELDHEVQSVSLEKQVIVVFG